MLKPIWRSIRRDAGACESAETLRFEWLRLGRERDNHMDVRSVGNEVGEESSAHGKEVVEGASSCSFDRSFNENKKHFCLGSEILLRSGGAGAAAGVGGGDPLKNTLNMI